MQPHSEPFSAFYAREIAPALQDKEVERQKAVATHRKALIIGVVAALAIGGGGFGIFSAPPQVVLILGAVALIGGFAYGQWKLQGVATDVKAILMERLARYAGVQFFADYEAPPETMQSFRTNKLLASYDRSTFEDLVEGERKGCRFSLFEAHLEDRRTDKDGKSTYVTVFRGQLLRVAFPRKFLGQTLVLRDAGLFNSMQAMGMGALKRVGLVDPTFEKIFEVYSSDQVEARYLLTPTYMESLMRLETQLDGKKVRAAFDGGDMLVAIEGGNLFEAGSMFEPLATPERAERVLEELETIHAMIDLLLEEQAEAAAKAGHLDPPSTQV